MNKGKMYDVTAVIHYHQTKTIIADNADDAGEQLVNELTQDIYMTGEDIKIDYIEIEEIIEDDSLRDLLFDMERGK